MGRIPQRGGGVRWGGESSRTDASCRTKHCEDRYTTNSHLSNLQDSSPYSSISSDIPLFTFTTNECGYNEQAESSHKERHAELHDGAFTIKLNNITVQNVKAPSFKKGILKQSNRQIMKWRTCNSAENLSCNESGVSDAEDPIPNHTSKFSALKETTKSVDHACSYKNRLSFPLQIKRKITRLSSRTNSERIFQKTKRKKQE